MASKEKREEWKRIGLCGRCGKNIPAEGRVTCQKCLDIMGHNRDYKRAHKLCVKCGRNVVSPNRKYCDECLEQRRNRYYEEKESKDYIEFVKLYRERHTQKYKSNGLCVWCGRPVFENHTLCYEHLIYHRNYMRRYRSYEKEYKGE